jgi:hypothetical protein
MRRRVQEPSCRIPLLPVSATLADAAVGVGFLDERGEVGQEQCDSVGGLLGNHAVTQSAQLRGAR